MEVKLKVLTGKNSGKEISVPVKRFVIGRADDCHLRPKSDAISRNHCAILVGEDEVVIRDLNSRNGTLLNGEAVKGDRVLTTGDVLKIGKIEFELAIKSNKPAPAPEPVKAKVDDGSMEFDVSEWLDEADAAARSAKGADPDTRQYKLDETDRIALEQSAQADGEASVTRKPELKRPEKREPGKLPVSAGSSSVTSSQDAAADMLKKFFNSR